MNELKLKIRKKEEQMLLLQSEKEQIVEQCELRIKEMTNNQQNLVDKRVIKEFLINYFDHRAPHKVRQHLLETICYILSMNETETEKIGTGVG